MKVGDEDSLPLNLIHGQSRTVAYASDQLFFDQFLRGKKQKSDISWVVLPCRGIYIGDQSAAEVQLTVKAAPMGITSIGGIRRISFCTYHALHNIYHVGWANLFLFSSLLLTRNRHPRLHDIKKTWRTDVLAERLIESPRRWRAHWMPCLRIKIKHH